VQSTGIDAEVIRDLHAKLHLRCVSRLSRPRGARRRTSLANATQLAAVAERWAPPVDPPFADPAASRRARLQACL
jgi:hypothetical protein